MAGSDSEQDDDRGIEPPRRSAAAEAAALRWEESEADVPVEPAASDRPSTPPRPVDRRSASAEAAALRWQEQHPDGDAG